MTNQTQKRTLWPALGLIGVLIAGAAVWLITSAPWKTDPIVNAPPSELVSGQTVTFEGTLVCLPHRDTSGPQTLECAYGLEASGNHYGLKGLSDDALETYQTGSSISVTGIFTKADGREKYDIVGTIDITEISKSGQSAEPSPSEEGENLLFENKEAGFSLSYSSDFNLLSEDENARLPWSADSSLPGRRIFTISLPKDFLPQTNFAEATVSVGSSNNAGAVADCITGEQGKLETTKKINGIDVAVIKLDDAGAGNLYETRSYRALKGGTCFALEATIHSTNLENYPAEQGITEFDKAKVEAALEAVVSTFVFLQ